MPTSLSYMAAKVPRKKPRVRAATGILKDPRGFFSLSKKPSKKTLRFQMDQTPHRASPPAEDMAQPDQQDEEIKDPMLVTKACTGEPSDEPKADKSESSSSTTPEEASYDKTRSRSRERRRSPPENHRASASSSSGEMASGAPYWMPKEIQHYFLKYRGDDDGVGGPSTKGVSSALQSIGSEQPPPGDAVADWKGFARQPHCALAALCFAAVFALIFAAMSADVYASLGNDRTPPAKGAGAGGSDNAGTRKELPGPDSGARSKHHLPHQHPGETTEGKTASAESTRRHVGAAVDGNDEHDGILVDDVQTDGETGSDGALTGAEYDLPRPITVDYMDTARAVVEVVHAYTTIEEVTLRSRVESKASCAKPVFAYCSSRRIEFYYERAKNVCVSTISDGAGVCNRGPNRFSSRQSCRQHCIEKDQPAKQCRQRAIFAECSRQDVSETWWYYSSKHCHRWAFPMGRCPANGSDVFTTISECWRRCSSREERATSRVGGHGRKEGRTRGQKHGRRPCRVPRMDHCGAEKLRFAYFAEIRGPRCRSVSAANQLGHRCLAGANRFQTVKACRKACVTPGVTAYDRRAPMYIAR